MHTYDIIIIGGGVTGMAVARELSRYKARIAVLEKEEESAFGVSKSNSGIIHPGTQNPAHSLKGRLCAQGNILFRKISKELGMDFKQVGELIVAFTDEDILKLESIKKEAELLGVPGLRIVGSRWLREHEPNLNEEARAALYAPTAGIVSPYRVVYDLGENALKNGVEIYLRHDVQHIACVQSEHRFEVTASGNVFRSTYLINCAGLYADDIASMSGVNDFRITPRKGEEYILDKKKQYLTNHLIFPLPSKTSKGILVIKTADGNPMIGPTAEDTEDKEDRSTSSAGFQKVLGSVKKLVPVINGDDVIAYFAGLRPVAGTDFIIRRELSVPGLVTVAGIQSPGLTAAPAIALMVIGLLRESGFSLKRKFIFYRHRPKSVHLFFLPAKKARALAEKNKSYGDIVCRCEMVSAQEIRDAVKRGARTMDGVKFRTRAQAGRCHGGFCT
ncbi:MAG: NAD(P)/FAD-dependent oxidoreductase, partial [Candidatus Omnitrophica bacterium]|nr:NAD(P)/FAD-dependent oxidoreductase [Candidatus Omnitrophota bacterium]